MANTIRVSVGVQRVDNGYMGNIYTAEHKANGQYIGNEQHYVFAADDMTTLGIQMDTQLRELGVQA